MINFVDCHLLHRSTVNGTRGGKDDKSHRTPDLLQRTLIYNDRNRLLATGAPMFLQEQRDAVSSLNSSTVLSAPAISKRIGTPVLESFHHAEPAGRREPILRRYMTEAGPRHFGDVRAWDRMRSGAASGDCSARRLDVRGYGGKVSGTAARAHNRRRC
jgi:hypothetical protein